MSPRPAIQAERDLTSHERAALEAFVANPLATKEDALMAGYPKSVNWAQDCRRRKASELFLRPPFRRELTKAMDKCMDGRVAEREKVRQHWEQIAYTDLPGIIDYEAGRLQIADFKDLTPAQKACIKKIKVRTAKEIVGREPVPISIVEIELHDKVAALNALSRIEGMFKDKLEITSNTNAEPAQVLAAILEVATDEEREVLFRMAARLRGQALPYNCGVL